MPHLIHWVKINKFAPLLAIFFLLLYQPSLAQKNEKFVLVLDAGHGGHDPGTRGVYDVEKKLALEMTLKLGKLIEDHFKKDVKVIYTRKDDRFIELHERANIANKNHADLFVSIHCNAGRSSAYGTETFVLGSESHRVGDNFSVVKRENSVIVFEEDHKEKYEHFNANSAESVIGLTLTQNIHFNNSLKFASYVEAEFTGKDKRKSRGVKQDGFLVLWRTATPSVLIETGFISNADENTYLRSKEGQKKTAESIFNAFKKYKTEWDLMRGVEVEDLPEDAKVKTPVEDEKPVPGKLFKIQFLTSKYNYPKSAVQFKGLKNIEKVKEGKVYKYFYGSTRLASKRDAFLKYVKGKGFPDAFVVEIPIREINSNNKEEVNIIKVVPSDKLDKSRTSGYRVQILTSSRNYGATAPQMKGLKPIDKISSNNLYRYYFGWYDTEEEAEKGLKVVKKKGFADAFVVQFKNNKKL